MNTREQYIDGLRELADRLERHPETPLPYATGTRQSVSLPVPFYSDTEREFSDTIRALGGGDKSIGTDGKLTVTGSLAGLHYEIVLMNGVCELVETGEVEEYEAVEVVTEAVTRTVSKSRPVLERRCPDSLLKLGAEVDV